MQRVTEIVAVDDPSSRLRNPNAGCGNFLNVFNVLQHAQGESHVKVILVLLCHLLAEIVEERDISTISQQLLRFRQAGRVHFNAGIADTRVLLQDLHEVP